MKQTILSLAPLLLWATLSPGLQQSPPAKHTQAPPDASQQKNTKLYIIRVIDTLSKKPVTKAKITVELDNTAKNKWTGITDSNGFFQFKWDAMKPGVRARISIEARGYASLEDYNLLMEDRLIELHKIESPTQQTKPAISSSQGTTHRGHPLS
ncbi:MAG TPA: hypothetical protein VI685_18860 [Candidatus Angelobacter sp.]